MNLKTLSLYSFLQWIILAFVKVWFFNSQIFSGPLLQSWVFWVITALVGAAVIRRFGVINYLEVFFILFAWVLGGAFLDLLITGNFTGLSIFTKPEYWISYIFLILSALIFHKKRHIQIRKELQAKHHAHGAGHHNDHHVADHTHN